MKGKNKEQTQIVINQSLSLPNVQPIDYQKSCPRYTSILNRPDGVGVGIEEMDSLQMEIESILVNVMQHTRSLKMETLVLDNWTSDKNDSILIQTPQKQINNAASTSAVKDSNTKEKNDSLLKKLKPTVSKPPQFALQNFIHTDAQQHVPIVRNDIPDIFWQSVEPYCADITEEDIKLLENQIELNQKYQSFTKTIGPLGKHYALQWAEEDLNQQMKEGQRFVDLDGKGSSPARSTVNQKRKGAMNELDKSFKKSTSFMLDDTLQIINGKSNHPAKSDTLTYGPLTQRLISALIEQNLMTPFDNELADYLEKIGPPQSMYLSPKSMAKKLTFSSTNSSSHSSLERKIKKTLIEQGILDFDENDKNAPESLSDDNGTKQDPMVIDKDDEIGLEIRNLQNELRTVTSQCELTLTQLLHTSKKKLIKQEVKKKITVLDYEVIEAYEKCKNARLEKRILTKKEKEKIFKLLKDRDSTKAQLDTFV